MIRKTLESLAASSSLAEMAERLGIGMDDLRLRLELLEEKGFIERFRLEACSPSSCEHKCSGCTGSSAPPAEGYQLLEKGRRALERD